MMDVGRHPNIKLLTNSEVEDISGYVGNFKARIRKKARYVEENDCTSRMIAHPAGIAARFAPLPFQMNSR